MRTGSRRVLLIRDIHEQTGAVHPLIVVIRRITSGILRIIGKTVVVIIDTIGAL
jgi:hypothetical protein